MDVRRLAKSAATRLPPVARLVASRDAVAAHALHLEQQVQDLGGALQRSQDELGRQVQAASDATGEVARLQGELRSASELHFDNDAIAAAAVGHGRYRSCDWIEEAVFFGRDEVNVCCMQSVGNSTPKLFELDGSEVRFSTIAEAKRRVRIANQTNRAPCGGCYLLKEGEWQAKDHLASIAVAGFLHCNLSCSYCVTYDFDPTDRGGNVFNTIRSLHEQGALKRDLSRIEWGGGESTFHRDFARVAEFAAEAGIRMTVYTNATAYVPAMEAGLRNGLFNIVCSIDAGFAETYARIKGRDLLDKVWTNLDRYAALNPAAVKLKYIVMEANSSAAELDEFLRRAIHSKAGVMIVSPNAHNNTGQDFVVSEAVEEASVYLWARARAAGLYVGASEFYEPGLRSRIEARGQEEDAELAPPAILKRNRPEAIEIAFVDSRAFRRKVSDVTSRSEDFRVVLLQPVSAAEAPPGLLGLLSHWSAPASADVGPLGDFLTAAGRDALSRDVDWPAELGGYGLTARFKGEGGEWLAALEFTRH